MNSKPVLYIFSQHGANVRSLNIASALIYNRHLKDHTTECITGFILFYLPTICIDKIKEKYLMNTIC